MARLFFERLILREIPVRGSLTIGQLYSQQKKNIFLGQALIDAHEYGEKQNWLGFVLTPSVYEELKGSELPLEKRPFYRRVTKGGIITYHQPENVYAFSFNNGEVNGKNQFLDAIQIMKINANGRKKVQQKYENTENFIQSHSRRRPNNK